MAPQNVPELRRKLHLLIDSGHFADMEAIAKAMGRSPVTLRGWQNGGSGGAPETVPARNMPSLVGLYSRVLPDLSKSEILGLLAGPADDLENALSIASASSLHALLRKEAIWDAATLIHDDPEFSLVRRYAPRKPAPQHRVELGKPFRLEFATRSRAGFVIGLQAAPSGWGIVPASYDREHNAIHLPGLAEAGKVGMMVEEGDLGRHVFIAAQAMRPFPAQMFEAGAEHVAIDRSLLAHFQRHFLTQDRITRRLFAVEIAFHAGGRIADDG